MEYYSPTAADIMEYLNVSFGSTARADTLSVSSDLNNKLYYIIQPSDSTITETNGIYYDSSTHKIKQCIKYYHPYILSNAIELAYSIRSTNITNYSFFKTSLESALIGQKIMQLIDKHLTTLNSSDTSQDLYFSYEDLVIECSIYCNIDAETGIGTIQSLSSFYIHRASSQGFKIENGALKLNQIFRSNNAILVNAPSIDKTIPSSYTRIISI